jgi:hypothetical protein
LKLPIEVLPLVEMSSTDLTQKPQCLIAAHQGQILTVTLFPVVWEELEPFESAALLLPTQLVSSRRTKAGQPSFQSLRIASSAN